MIAGSDHPQTVDLYSTNQDWKAMPIPDSTAVAKLTRLFIDPATSASLSLVEFPRGWRRPGLGSYTVAEEFVVLRGSITVSGIKYREGDYAFIPAHAPRSTTETPTGCLALAAFSGPPRWQSGASLTRPNGKVIQTSAPLAWRGTGSEFQGEMKVRSCTPNVSTTPKDLIQLETGIWHFVPPGFAAPPVRTPTMIRWW